MSARRIEFTYLPTPHGSSYIWSPVIPVRISKGRRTTPYLFRALIDSGADVNLIPALHGAITGIDIKPGLAVRTHGVGGVVKAYRHNIKLIVGNKEFNTTADFTYDFPLALLGRRGFFDLFKKVSFREKEKVVVLDI